MKLLIVTQVVDKHHPVLGFFHAWIIEFAKHWEHVHVICLYAGEHELPENISVHSLGKEGKEHIPSRVARRAKYIRRFFSLIYSLRHEYDVVFVHMNAEYLLLGGWLWRFLKKKVALWYNHTVGSVSLRLAAPIAEIVFHTSPYAFTASHARARRMPAGIDTSLFKPVRGVKKIPGSVYFQGRIARSKNVHVLMEVFANGVRTKLLERLTLVGPEETEYTAALRQKYHGLIRDGAMCFLGPIDNSETPRLYSAHEVSVNLTAKGNYDKSVLESIACGTPVITTSSAFSDVPGVTVVAELSPESFDLRVSKDVLKEGWLYVEEHHGLSLLAKRVRDAY